MFRGWICPFSIYNNWKKHTPCNPPAINHSLRHSARQVPITRISNRSSSPQPNLDRINPRLWTKPPSRNAHRYIAPSNKYLQLILSGRKRTRRHVSPFSSQSSRPKVRLISAQLSIRWCDSRNSLPNHAPPDTEHLFSLRRVAGLFANKTHHQCYSVKQQNVSKMAMGKLYWQQACRAGGGRVYCVSGQFRVFGLR